MTVFLAIIITAALVILFGLILTFTTTRDKSELKQLQSKLSQLEKTLEERARLTDRLQQEAITQLQEKLLEKAGEQQLAQQQNFNDFKETITEALNTQRQSFDKRQIESMQSLQVSLQKGLKLSSDMIGERVEKLTTQTDNRLKDISGQVEKRLNEGFEKTNEVFSNVMKRLALIDEAQKKITELSSNVVDLQAVLNDKRSRGAFGEIQLSALLRNALPENTFSLQHSLSNGTRADCMLFLPEPTGHVAIDAKFPLESFKVITDLDASSSDKQAAEKQFRQDIKKHIGDIASKYIVPGETADGAIMFIPAEAVFAEIHAHYPELVELAQRQHVWLVSPTTMMAILTTARAVIKDEATRRQVHIIREHLSYLSKDFDRFQTRMDNLARHIRQANNDVEQVHTSAQKISARFEKIEQVELQEDKPLQIEN
jgi:DNA recombination protein RmuC